MLTKVVNLTYNHFVTNPGPQNFCVIYFGTANVYYLAKNIKALSYVLIQIQNVHACINQDFEVVVYSAMSCSHLAV